VKKNSSINRKLEDFILSEIKRQILKEENQFDTIENDFESILKSMVGDMKAKTSDLEKLQNDKEQIKMALRKAPDLAKVVEGKIKRSESKKKNINEVDTVFFIGLALALPKIAEITATLIEKLVKKLGGGDKSKIAEFLRTSAEKMHHVYVKIVRVALLAVPSFRSSDNKTQQKVAEIVFTLIIAGLAVYSGYNAVKAGISTLGALEGAIAAIKSGEVVQFLSKEIAALA
jgi:hypothetical protein